MSDEIYINTGSTFQQPFNQRNPAAGTVPTIAQRVAQQPAITQQPSTYQNRSPFTYRHPASAQQPYIASAQQPYPYIASNQTPYIASARQPYPYTANAQQAYPYIANAQTPSIENAQQPYPYIAAQGQQPYPYISQQPSTYARQGQQPYPYISQQPATYSNRQPLNARQPYSYQNPYTYQASGTGQTTVSVTETPYVREGVTWNLRYPDISTITNTGYEYYFDAEDLRSSSLGLYIVKVYHEVHSFDSGGSRYFDFKVKRATSSMSVWEGLQFEYGTSLNVNIGTNSFLPMYRYVFPSTAKPTDWDFKITKSFRRDASSAIGMTNTYSTGVSTYYGTPQASPTFGQFQDNVTTGFGMDIHLSYSGTFPAQNYGWAMWGHSLIFQKAGYPNYEGAEITGLLNGELTYFNDGNTDPVGPK